MKIFDLKSAGTTFSHEIMGGVVTFMTMSYIIFVQPSMLANAGMDFGAITFATCISSAIATLIMGLYAKLPIAQAPGMGENIFFTYTVVIGMGLAWPDALGAVFVAGVIFLILSILKVREKILNSIPISLRYAIAVGIGLFISFIGMINSGIIIKSVGGVLQIGDVHSYHFLLALFCLFVVMILMIKKVPGAIFIGIIISTIVALSTGAIQYCGIISTPPSPAPTFLKLSLSNIFNHHFLTAVFIFLFLDVFDTVGTLFAVAATGNLLTKDGRIKSGSKAMLSDAIGTVVGALFGTSTVTSYIESTTGIVAGARTGLSSVVVALLFLLSLFFYPIIRLVGSGMIVGNSVFNPITGPVLILVGVMIASSIQKIHWEKTWIAIPAFLTIIGIPLTYSISDGMAMGFISYPICAVAAGETKEVSTFMWVIAALFIVRYVFFNV